MKKLIPLLLLSFFQVDAMRGASVDVPVRERSGSLTKVTPYIPESYDLSSQLQKESKCCFFTSRWILQPINVISPLIATAFVGVGEYYINTNQSMAATLNAIGIGFSAAGFISSVLLVKVNSKLQGIDEYISQHSNKN